MSNEAKLNTLCEIEGFEDSLDLIEAYIMDSIVPAICMNEGCDATADMEPDQDKGFCEQCRTNTMKSALILGGVI